MNLFQFSPRYSAVRRRSLLGLRQLTIGFEMLAFTFLGFTPNNLLVNGIEPLETSFAVLEENEKGLSQSLLIAADKKSIEDSLWYLSDYLTDSGAMVEAKVFVENPYLQFSDNLLGGNGTCNRIFGSYSLEGNKLSITPDGSTLMICPDEFMSQEEQVLKALKQVTGYVLNQDRLQLLDKDQKILLTFDRTMALTFTNTLWQLNTYNNGQGAIVSLVPGSKITATFDNNGGLAGFAGCNNYLAGYTYTNESIEISFPISTRKFCGQPEGIMTQESAYLQSLSNAEVFKIEGDTLTLSTASGETVAQFKAVEVSD